MPRPLISVIVPTCHRDDLLALCLQRLAPGAQSLPVEDYEVIVTDDGSKTTAEQMIREQFPSARWVQGPRKGPAANRNNGARHATGDWLVFTDDDCLPDAGWLRAIATAAAAGEAEVIEGRTVTPDKVDNPFLQGIENLKGGSYWSCNLAVRRSAFWDIGGFDEDFLEAAGEDMEFAFRFRQRGLRPRFCPDALVLHPVRRVSFQRLIWWTRTARWLPLYHLKSGSAPALGSSAFQTAAWLVRCRFLFLARSSWQFFRHFDSTTWKTKLFFKIWEWLTFPIVLPYMLLWDRRFRRSLTVRGEKSGATEESLKLVS